jgi:hypothetical protein
VAALAAAAGGAFMGIAILRRQLDVRLAAIRRALGVALVGWLAAAMLWAIGATGWLEAVMLALAVVALQFRQLTPSERRWLADRLRRPAPAVSR